MSLWKRIFGRSMSDATPMDQHFTFQQASRGEIDCVKATIRSNPAKYGTAGGILARDPTNSGYFALLVYDFEK